MCRLFGIFSCKIRCLWSYLCYCYFTELLKLIVYRIQVLQNICNLEELEDICELKLEAIRCRLILVDGILNISIT